MKKLFILISLTILSNQITSSQIGYIFKENKEDAKIGVLSPKGDVVLKNEFKSVFYQSGYLFTLRENKYGHELYEFKSGKFVSDSVSRFVSFGGGYLLVKKHQKIGKTKWGIIDKTGKLITGYIYDDVYSEKVINNHVQVIKNGKFLLVNTSGKAVISTESRAKFLSKLKKYQNKKNDFEDIEFMYDSEATISTDIFQNLTTGKFGLKTSDKIVLTDKYSKIEKTSCDSYILKSNGKYGVASLNGQVILNVIYDEKPEVLYWKVIAVKNGKYGAYDGKSGETIISPEYGFLSFL